MLKYTICTQFEFSKNTQFCIIIFLNSHKTSRKRIIIKKGVTFQIILFNVMWNIAPQGPKSMINGFVVSQKIVIKKNKNKSLHFKMNSTIKFEI